MLASGSTPLAGAPGSVPSGRTTGSSALTILHVAAPAPVGGLERVVRSLALGQRAAGHRVHLLLVVDPGVADHAMIAPLQAVGVQVEVVEVPARGYRQEWRMMQRLCTRIRPDVVHTHGFRPDVVDGAAARRKGTPVVATVHGFIRGSWKGRLYEWLQRRAYRSFSAVAAVSRPQVEELVNAGVPRERVHLVPNAWARFTPSLTRAEARARLGVTGDAFLVGWVGRLSYEKGADVLLDALALAPDLPALASIVGAGREEERLRARADSLGLGERVRWQGLVPEAGPLFPAFDVFVISSRTEGTPIALFEAMDAGVPVVAARVGGIPEVVSAAEALLIPAEDARSLSRAIQEVYAEPEAARSRAAAASERLRSDFGPAPWLAAYERIYRQVQHSNPARALL